MANVKEASSILKRQDSSQFLTLQEYRLNVLVQNFSLIPPCLDIHCAFAIAIVFAYLLGSLTSKTPIDFADRHYYAT
jgi:hypothetical protein